MPSARSKAIRIIRYGVLLLLLSLVLATRYVPGVGEWYATVLYPVISALLSAVASLVPFSLEEWIVVGAGLWLIISPIFGLRHHAGLGRVLFREVELGLWLFVWFYVGWGCNYYRTDFYTRLAVEPVQQENELFEEFLAQYVDDINACYPSAYTLDSEAAERLVKELYCQLPQSYGLCQPHHYQHSKPVVFNRLYSAVGVLGYMGPFMAESQLNMQLLPEEYPFTYAHELAHLLGISSEAESNYWAYAVCTSSADSQLRYSGYFGLLAYLINNSASLLTPEEHQAWISRLDPRILHDLRAKGQHWQRQQIGWINELQERFYDWYLRSNQVPQGRANYSQVVRMLLSVHRSSHTAAEPH